MSNKPLSVDRALMKAKSLAKKRDLTQAMELYTTVLEKFPGNKRAIEGMKSLKLLKSNQEQVTSNTGPTQQQINGLISLYKQGRNQEALEQGTALAEQYPNMPLIPNILGAVYVVTGRPEEAATSYSKALQLKPDDAETHSNLGNVLKAVGKHEEAIASYSKALQLRPDLAEVHNNLSNVLKAVGRHEEAIASLTKALQLKPNLADAHNNLGNALSDLGKHKEAIASLTEALQLKPDFAEAHFNLGSVLTTLGKFEDAISSYSKALQLKPNYVMAHTSLGKIKKYKIDDPQITQMQELITNRSIAEIDKRRLRFTLGKAYDDIGDAESSFQHFLEGNRLEKKELGYDISADRWLFSTIESIFEASDLSNIAEIQPIAERKKRPIFIVGMPRSGTTLVEQILASHSLVYGAGELQLMQTIIKSILDDVKRNHDVKLIPDTIISIRNSYLTELDTMGGGKLYITDKMPRNFRWIGFILTAMPEAKVINLQRDPAATCWSVFKCHFSSKRHGYAYDLVDIAEYYKLYIRLMDFWRKRFPSQIYDINYEDLTENSEEEIRKLLEYCGLSWEAKCLEFHKAKGAVKTASLAQVRRAMYKGSSEAWRKYEAHLQPMLQALKG